MKEPEHRSQDLSVSMAPPGIPGKRVTLVVLLGLALLGVGISYTLWTYNRVDTARAATATAWRNLTEHLSSRYRAAEKTIAEGVDSRAIKMEFGERFRLAVDGFRTTSLPLEQYAAAQRVESLLGSEDLGISPQALPSVPPDLRASLESFRDQLEQERQLLEGLGGRMLDIFMKFETTAPLSLAN